MIVQADHQAVPQQPLGPLLLARRSGRPRTAGTRPNSGASSKLREVRARGEVGVGACSRDQSRCPRLASGRGPAGAGRRPAAATAAPRPASPRAAGGSRRYSLGACSFSSAVENEKNSVLTPSTSLEQRGGRAACRRCRPAAPAGRGRRPRARRWRPGWPGGRRRWCRRAPAPRPARTLTRTPVRGLRGDVGDDGLDHGVRVLAGHQAAGHVGHRDVRDHGVLPAAVHAVDLQRRPLPEPLQRAVPGLAVRLGQAEGARGTPSRRTGQRRSRGGAAAVSSGMPS